MSKFSGKPTFDVYVTNLPDDIDEESMKQEFSLCGAVHSCTVKDGKNNASKFGFVRYLKEESQDLAVNKLNGKFLNGKPVNVRKADYKKKNITESTMQNGEMKRPYRGDYQSSSPRNPDQQKATPDYIEQEILVTYVVDACTVYAQLAQRTMVEVNAKLMAEINQYCPVAQRLTGPPSLNTVYGCLFSEDGMWYRCKVMPNSDLSGQPNAQVGVHYMDYGNDEIVGSSTLVELPMSLASLQAQAHMLIFHGIASTAENITDNRKAVEFLQQVTGNKSVLAHLFSPLISDSSCTPVEVFDGTASLNDALIQQGFAIKVAPLKPLKTSEISPKPAVHNATSSPNRNASTQGSPSPAKTAASSNQSLLDTPSPQPINIRSSPLHTSPGGIRVGPGGVSAEKHNSEMQTLKTEIKHLKVDKAELVKCCKENLGQVARITAEKHEIQVEFQSVKEAAANTVSCLNHLEGEIETYMQDKVTGLLATMATLRQTRKQVVIDPDVRDPLEAAIRLLTNSTNAFVSLRDGLSDQDASDACRDFLHCQGRFEDPDAKEFLDELIVARDTSRKTAYEKISAFLDAVNLLPLMEKKSQLRQSLVELEETYDIDSYGNANLALTGCGDGDRDHVNICINYKQWKEKKSKQLKVLRENTDARAAEWRRIIQANVVDPFDFTSSTTKEQAPALDELACAFMVAMETEIAMTGLDNEDVKVNPELLEKKKEECCEEAAILQNTVTVVIVYLRKELDAVDKILADKTSYTETKNENEKWLTARPDVTKLLATKKIAKSLRSKLRHKLPDKLDLEENPELDTGGELQKIEEELGEICLALQRAYIEEDRFMIELANLKQKQFRELSLQYPSFEIENHLTSLGAVKLGRDIQHFDLKPMPGCDKKMIRLAQFDNKPVVVKSFFIPDDELRAEFLMQASLTWAFSPEGLLRVDAIYASPSKAEVHVHMPYVEMGSLEAAIAKQGCFASEPLTDEELKCIFCNVLEGLSHIHEISCFHGAIHPRNVLLTSRSSALLAEYDNSKTPTQRARQGYKSSNGLGFTAPEINNGVKASYESDLYSFGILLLWAHYPDVQFPSLPDGTPDLTVVEIKPSIKDSVTSLLKFAHVTRPSTQNLRCRNYFDYTSDEGSYSSSQGDRVEDGDKEVHMKDGTEEEEKEEEVTAEDGDVAVDGGVIRNGDVDPKDEVTQGDEMPNGAQDLLDESLTEEENEEGKDDNEEDITETMTKVEEREEDEEEEERAGDDMEKEADTEPEANKQVQQGILEKSSTSTGSILLKKMAIAMATSEEKASKETGMILEGSEI